MRSHKSALAFDVMLTVMAYLIFAISLLAVNIIKYLEIKIGFFALLILSGAMMLYCLNNYNKDLK